MYFRYNDHPDIHYTSILLFVVVETTTPCCYLRFTTTIKQSLILVANATYEKTDVKTVNFIQLPSGILVISLGAMNLCLIVDNKIGKYSLC